jgi:branched-chain amino acid transport system substrate-binding protein
MNKYLPDGDRASIFSVYGYLAAQTLAEVLKQCGDDLTRENVLKQAADLKDLKLGLLLPGITINTGPSDYFPIKQMQLSRFNGENVELIGSAMGGDFTSGAALQKR